MDDQNQLNYPGEEHHYSPPPYSQTGKITPNPRPREKRLLPIFIASTAILLIIVIVFGLTILHSSTTSSPNSSAPVLSATPTTQVANPAAPTSTSLPGATSATTPTASATLPCDVNVGTWTGGSADWKAFNGMLLNDGTNNGFNSNNGPTIIAPCQLGNTANYAVETTIQVTSQSGPFGITIRGGSSASGSWQGYMAGVGDPAVPYLHPGLWGNAYITGPGYPSADPKVQGSFVPDNRSHTYRVEVNGNVIKFFIDGNPLLTFTDNRYLTGSQVGLWSDGVQLQVTSFKVTAL